MIDLNDIKKLIDQEDFTTAEKELKSYLSEHKESDMGHFLMGNLYRKREDWESALNEYQEAMDINENSPAKLAYNAIQEVLAFYNKDMFNQ